MSDTPVWQLLTISDPKSLKEAYLQQHHAVQFVARVAKSYLPNKADDSHTNLGWHDESGDLLSHFIDDTFYMGLNPETLSLRVYDPSFHELGVFDMDGATENEVTEWIKESLEELGYEVDELVSKMHYDLPDHPTASGATFNRTGQEGEFAELARFRANSDVILAHIAGQFETASDVRTWPHHFDHGSYIPVAFDEAGEATKSFGIGLGLPDPYSDQPYFYINLWQKDGELDDTNLPELAAGGQWNQKDWHGAILEAEAFVGLKTAEEQLQAVHDFFHSAINAVAVLLHEQESIAKQLKG